MRLTTKFASIGTVLAVAAGLAAVGPVAPASAAAPTTGRFTPVASARAWSGTVGTTAVAVTLGGRSGIPTSATAVALTVTASSPTATGSVFVSPYGVTSNQTTQAFTKGVSVSGATAVALSGGRAQVRLSSGTAKVSLDVAGWYGTSASGSTFTAVKPTALLRGAVGTTAKRLAVTGKGGVPANATAVVLQTDVSRPAASGTLRITPAGKDAGVSTVTYRGGVTISNTTTVALAGGAVQARVSSGTATVDTDVVGYYAPNSTGSVFVPSPSGRAASAALTTTGRSITVAGAGGIPRNATAAMLTTKVSAGSAASSLRVSGASGASDRPTQVYAKGQIIGATVVLPLAKGTVAARVLSGKATLSLDVVGYFLSGASGSGTGVDVSYPQCGTTLPTDQSFGIVGVNGELANTTNPCLQQELAWAAESTGGTAQPKAQVYSLFTNPGAASASVWPSSNKSPAGTTVANRFGTCAPPQAGLPKAKWITTLPCSYMYGYARAYEASTTRGVANPAQYRWWLDVEEGLSYVKSDTSQNRAALEGMVAALGSAGVKQVGVYSTASHFRTIMGTVPAASPLRPLTSWVAIGGGNLGQAQAACAQAPFLGGRVAMTQYVTSYGSAKLDRDWSCS